MPTIVFSECHFISTSSQRLFHQSQLYPLTEFLPLAHWSDYSCRHRKKFPGHNILLLPDEHLFHSIPFSDATSYISPLLCFQVHDFSGIFDLKVTQAGCVDAGWLSLQHMSQSSDVVCSESADKLYKMKVRLKWTLPIQTENTMSHISPHGSDNLPGASPRITRLCEVCKNKCLNLIQPQGPNICGHDIPTRPFLSDSC